MNNILVINGSPKGKNSITLHTCLFLEKKFPGYKFDYLDAGQRIKVLEKDFSPALEAIREADLLVFCYPVYTFLVPSQLHATRKCVYKDGFDEYRGARWIQVPAIAGTQETMGGAGVKRSGTESPGSVSLPPTPCHVDIKSNVHAF